MDTDVFVIIINPNDSTYTDTLTSAREIKARGAKIIGVSDIESDVYDYWMKIPKINEILYPISEIIPIQLLAYYSALEKDTDPDYPRNLAKSVTVKEHYPILLTRSSSTIIVNFYFIDYFIHDLLLPSCIIYCYQQ